ncbi:Putative transmembrane protein [Methyloversatilis universalis FAM5]|uniref:Transmembrane protein n=1 Tax=Methyloversatilis universalis (strain ATCC BAA-1314 / DSM 25237 / JCM 13912 / CCUG 52030 / FAM5) TaxID=1000565 RepID=F5RGE6_METUF|nr:DMT family transporter [Methyloversatilis universalis]EGK70338.1 Putative transmembrane protein [Methyloversatilis universalis FAM5]
MSALLAPVLFVLVWSTGFIVARAIDGAAAPGLFLCARFVLTTLLFGGIAFAAGARWPARDQWPTHLIAGALLQGVYMGGGYWAVSHGLSPAVMALLATLQPMLTALVAQRLFGEPLGRHFWGGLLAGALGVGLVLAPHLATVGPEALSPGVLAVALLSVAAITAGTLIQKTSIAATDLSSSSALQNAAGALVTGVAALLLGESLWVPGVALWGALAWAVLGLSAIGSTLLVWMVRQGSAARVSVLVLLVPPLAAVQAALLFGERLSPLQIGGFALALGGVLLCRRR